MSNNYFVKIKVPGYKPSVLNLGEIKRVEIIDPFHHLYEKVRDGKLCVLISLKDGSSITAEMSDGMFDLFIRFLAAISQNDEEFLKCTANGHPELPELFDKQ